MFGPDVIVIEALGFFLSEDQNLLRPLRELVEPVAHRNSSPRLRVSPLTPYYTTVIGTKRVRNAQNDAPPNGRNRRKRVVNSFRAARRHNPG